MNTIKPKMEIFGEGLTCTITPPAIPTKEYIDITEEESITSKMKTF